MEALEAILSRRAVRQYTGAPVSDEDVETILRAAMQAPSANNGQPWQFIVIRDRAMLDAIAGFHPYGQMLKQAPLAILVCGDEQQTGSPIFWSLDCSAAAENLLLAVHARGLGGVWVSVHPVPERIRDFRNLCALPDHVHPLVVVPVGHPLQQPAPEDRFKPDRIHLNRW